MEAIGGSTLFGTGTRTASLLLIAMLEETHAGEIAQILGKSRSRIKDAVDSLESEGVITGAVEGTARRLQLNARYVAAKELRDLLEKLAQRDIDLQQRLGEMRRRPRRAGKAI